MKFEFFSVPACSPEKGQQELNAFCGSHRIVSIEKQFVPNGEQSYWGVKKVTGEEVALLSPVQGAQGRVRSPLRRAPRAVKFLSVHFFS